MSALTTVISGNGRSFTLPNPVMTASGTFGFGIEFAPFGDLKDLGAVVVKGLSLKSRDGNPMPRIAETKAGMLNAIGLQNPGAGVFVRSLLPNLLQHEVSVIANLYATTVEEFAELAQILSVEGISALEVNVSCPNVQEGGVAFGQDPRMVEAVTKAVCKATKLPVIVKLSPNVTDITTIAKACADAGATALSCINTVRGMAVDLPSRSSLVSTGIAGLSGPAIKPIALRCVWEVSQAVGIPVIGVGGIVCAKDVLEFILAGAIAVQVGTANFMRPDMAFQIANGVSKAMQEYRIDSLASLRGSLRFP